MANMTKREMDKMAMLRGDMSLNTVITTAQTTATTVEIPTGIAKALEEARGIVGQFALGREQLEQRIGYALLPVMQISNGPVDGADGPEPVVSLLEERLRLLNRSLMTELVQLSQLVDRAQQ